MSNGPVQSVLNASSLHITAASDDACQSDNLSLPSVLDRVDVSELHSYKVAPLYSNSI